MRAPVFVAEPAQLAQRSIVLDGPEGRHAAAARRLTIGEHAEVTDGRGAVACCVVTQVGRDRVELAVRERRAEPAPQPRLVAVQAIAKADRGERAVELMTEVGVDVIVPWAAERCVAEWRGERAARHLERWRATAREAAKQARRYWFPEVTGQQTTASIARRVTLAELAITLDPAAEQHVDRCDLPAGGEIVIIIGPEGGLTSAETARLAEAGARPARLGPTVLRTSSAGAVAAAVLLSRARWR